MKISYDDLTSIYKYKLLQKISDISIGNLAYEVIEEIETTLNINLPDHTVQKLIDMASDSEIKFNFSTVTMDNKTSPKEL